MVTAICSFLALGAIYVNAGLLIGIFFFLISYPWGGMQFDLGHLIANEKLIGELVGVGNILSRILCGSWLKKIRSIKSIRKL